MRISKYIMAFILFAISVCFLMFLGISSGFLTNEYCFTCKNVEEIDPETFSAVAHRHNVKTFTHGERHLSIRKTAETYYASANDMEWLKHYLGVTDGLIRSFSGFDTEVSFQSIKNIDISSDEFGLDKWYLIGELQNCKDTVKDLKNNYDCSIKGESPYFDFTLWIPHFIFAVSLFLLLLYCYLCTAMEKKEIAIRVIHGESPMYHYVRISLTDSIVFTILFFICIFAQSKYTQIFSFYRKACWLFLPFLALLWIINSQILWVRPKELLYGYKISENIGAMLSFLSKVVAVCCCIGLLAICSSLPTVQKYNKAELLFCSNENYSFMEYHYPPEINDKILNDNSFMNDVLRSEREFEKETDELFQKVIIYDCSYEYHGYLEPLYCNHRALPYLQSVISEASSCNLSDYDMAILLPDNMSKAEEGQILKYLKFQFRSYEGYDPEKDQIQMITYTPTEEIISFGNNSSSNTFAYHTAPAICIATDIFQRKNCDLYHMNHQYLTTGSLILLPDEQKMQSLVNDKQFEVSTSNAYEMFQIDFSIEKSKLLLSVLTIILVLAFYVSVTSTVLRLDYSINAMELAIKKTLGYSILNKHRKHFIGLLVSGIVNLVISVVYSHYHTDLPVYVSFAVPIFLLLLQSVLVYCMIIQIERKSITKILKGGAL